MIHELGHTFSSLADEYWAGSQYARETYNLTQTSNVNDIRWKNFLNQNGIGIYAHEESPTWYRPHQNCKMRFLGRDFCMVCSNELRKRIEILTASTPLQWPLAFFGADKREIFEGQKVNFYDLSNEEPTAWEWTFEGGNPETSNLQNPTVTYPNEGVYQVSLKTSNSLGSSSINRTQYIHVTKTDTEPPVIRLKNLTVNLNEMGKVKISPDEINDGTTDNTGIRELILSKTEFDCNDIGENEIIFKAIDINGNENTQSAIITVVDKNPPTVLIRNFTLMLDEDGNGILLPENIDNGSFDNCGIESRSLSKSNFTKEDNGENLVTLTVRDLYGNESSKTANVRVDMILSNPEENIEEISINPNPSQGIIQIEFPNYIGTSLKYLEIINSNGNVIKALKEIPENEMLILVDITDFPNGVYFVRLFYPDEIKSLKFILKK
jgi:PKD repeat protein